MTGHRFLPTRLRGAWKLLSAGVGLASRAGRLAPLIWAEIGLRRGLGGAEFSRSPLFSFSLWGCPTSTEEPECGLSLSDA